MTVFSTVKTLITIRYAGIIPLLAILAGFTFTKYFSKYIQIALSITSFTVLVLFFLQLSITVAQTDSVLPYGIYYLTHSIFLLVYQFSWSRLLFPYAVITFGCFVPVFILISVFVLSGDILVMKLSLTAANIDGCMIIFAVLIIVAIMLIVACYSAENYIRKRWILKLIVEKEREKIEVEKHLSESLLLNIFPKEIAQRFKRSKEGIAEEFESATIFFSDIVGFTTLGSTKACMIFTTHSQRALPS